MPEGIELTRLDALTDEFLDMKQRYFPGLPYSSTKPLESCPNLRNHSETGVIATPARPGARLS